MSFDPSEWRATRSRAILSLVISFLLASCTRTFFISADRTGKMVHLDLREVRERNTQKLERQIGKTAMSIFYTPEEEDVARVTDATAGRAIRYIIDILDDDPAIPVTLYLYPWPAGRPWPSYQTTGRGYTAVLFYPDATSFLTSMCSLARVTLHHGLVHELVIGYLNREARFVTSEDRRILEGLPEALADAYAHEVDPDLWLTWDVDYPQPTALLAYPPQKWSDSNLRRFFRHHRTNPRVASYYYQREAAPYAASKALLVRWLEAAKSAGMVRPVPDLIRRLKAKKRIDWPATQELAKEQTGKTIQELATIDEEEAEALRSQAWRQRLSSDWRHRVRAARVLYYLGLPATVRDLSGLRESFFQPLPDAVEHWAEAAYYEAIVGIAADSGETKLIDSAIEWITGNAPKIAYLRSLPKLWEVHAGQDPNRAVDELCNILRDDHFILAVQEQAALSLEKVTGQSLGWDAENQSARRRAAKQCEQIVANVR